VGTQRKKKTRRYAKFVRHNTQMPRGKQHGQDRPRQTKARRRRGHAAKHRSGDLDGCTGSKMLAAATTVGWGARSKCMGGDLLSLSAAHKQQRNQSTHAQAMHRHVRPATVACAWALCRCRARDCDQRVTIHLPRQISCSSVARSQVSSR
jgi:hypothetical protein